MHDQSSHSDSIVNRTPFYYGWVILAVGAIGLILTSPGQTFTVSIFINHIIAELDVSRSVVSLLYGVATVLASFTLPLMGTLIDRHGPRLMVVVIASGLGLACIFMGLIQNLFMLGVGFFAIRMLGQGSLGIVSQNTINRWWVYRRGSILGISGLMFALLGVGLFPNLAHFLINNFEWRMAYMILGGVVISILVPLGILFFRDRPEDFGLLPDGLKEIPDERTISEELVEINWTLPEAIRTPAFWVAAAGFSSVAMLATALTFHIVDIFLMEGLPVNVAAISYVPLAVTSAVLTLTGGILADKMRVKYLVFLALMFQGLALWFAMLVSSTLALLLFQITLGATFGLSQISGSVLWARYFGRLHLGRIQGTVATITVSGTAVGPVLFGVGKDLFKTYDVVLIASSLIPLSLGIAMLFFGKPKKPVDQNLK